MIISAQSIRRLCMGVQNPMLHPFHERTVHNGKTFGLSSAGYDVRVDLGDEFPEGWAVIRPLGCELVATQEHFIMPPNVLGIVHDKSSWARKFLTVQNTVIEPGWRGYLTLELVNHSKLDISLRQGDPIAQIVFHWLDEPTEQPYEGKYQDQAAGPQEALEETS